MCTLPSKVLVSFATRPGKGSEGGVGWAFLCAGLEWAQIHNERLNVVVDGRDEEAIRSALPTELSTEHLALFPVLIPTAMWWRYGDSRTRETYLSWLFSARAKVRELVTSTGADVVHQVTFASAVLPPAIPRMPGIKRVWGPLSVPWAHTPRRGMSPRRLRAAAVPLARRIALFNSGAADLLIATNERTGTFLEKGNGRHGQVLVEPNVVAETPDLSGVVRDDCLLSFVGLLTELKQPRLAIEALTYPALRAFALQIIGDGPLRGALEHYVDVLGLRGRVLFKGHLPRRDAVLALAKSRVLVHPSVREGASWVVGEAAAVGVPAVVFDDVGATTTVRFSNNGGVVCERIRGDESRSLARGIVRAACGGRPSYSSRWSSSRLPALLDDWWSTSESQDVTA